MTIVVSTLPWDFLPVAVIMDGTTEPILVVIGHPIAGNPTQFAAERALRSLKLDWRVLSFDVQPTDVAAALTGLAVIGIDGVIIDESLLDEARRWFAEQNDRESTGSEPVVIDCLSRDDAFRFVGTFEQRDWVDQQIHRHGGNRLVWIGQRSEHWPASGDGFEFYPEPPADIGEQAGKADVIVIAPSVGQSLEIDADDWPRSDGSTLVIDLTSGHPEIARIKQLGYRVVGENERRIGTLQRCLHRTTGQSPSAEVIYDAIEEYLGV